MQRGEWWVDLTGLAEAQAGLFTAAQAQQCGAQRPQIARLASNGTIERLLHGVYQLSGTPVDQWTQTRAAWLSVRPERTASERLNTDPDGVISHRSAAHLLGLGDLEADRVEITLGRRHRTRNPDVLIHRGTIDRADWMVREGLPVTTPSKTVATLALAGIDMGHLATITRDALLKHDTAAGTLIDALTPAAQRYGYENGTTLFDDLIQQAGIPVNILAMASKATVTAIAPSVSTTEIATSRRGFQEHWDSRSSAK